MDSKWINLQGSGGIMNNYDQHNNTENYNLDLTLKLGLPNSEDDQNQAQRFNLNIPAPNYTHEEMNTHYDISNERGPVSNNVGGQTFQNNTNNPSYAWPPLMTMGRNAHCMQPNVQAFGGQFSGISPDVPLYMTSSYHPYTNSMMNPNHYMPSPPSVAMNDYTLIDIPMRRVNRELQGESSSSGAGGSRRRSSMRPQQTVIDPYKRCTNYNCNTNVTPMWRKGPLGPKTLCNACGIKYKKEENRKKAMEAASSRSNNQIG
ncbi:hypothetical protein ACOSQ2_017686 [Xanthoceras sorbifolium]